MSDDHVRKAAAGASPVLPPDPGKDHDFELRLARLPRNDIGNAERFIARSGQDFFWVKEAGWYGWDGKRWDFAGGEVRARLAGQACAAAMRHEAIAVEKEGPLEDEKPKETDDRIEAHYKWATQSGNATRLGAMLDVAAPRLARTQDALDADPWLFNVANGTLVLGKRGEDGSVTVILRTHQRGDLITRASPVAYDPAATNRPRFTGFLDYFQPSGDVQAFLQRLFGYFLSGSIEEQIVALLHGEGSNGKSTLVDLLAWIMGDYSMSLPINSLLANDRRGGGEASPDLARLPGARMVRSAEPPQGATLHESLLKQVTGGEPMAVRHLNKGFFDFRPTFKLVLSFNRKPFIRGDDDGTWRRLPMVKFDVQIKPDMVDLQFGEKLKAEASAILNWLVDGYRCWREKGLAIPAEVTAATKEYRSESDDIGNFLASVIEVTAHDGDELRAKYLYKTYDIWCRRNGQEPRSQSKFGRRIADVKGVTKKISGTVTYHGLKVTDPGLLADAIQEADQRPPGGPP